MSDHMARQCAKVFIGGLSWETTGEKLRAYFENYGVVREAFVSYNRNNGRPRGFGFVVFESTETADKVVATKHTIDRREVEAKRAVPKDESLQPEEHGQSAAGGQPVRGDAAANMRSRKIFVGGLSPAVDENALREYFNAFGAVEDAVVMYDHDKRPRGFGFVTFTSEEAVEAVFAKGAMQSIQDKQIEIKAAVPRDLMPPSSRSQHAMFMDPRFAGPRAQQQKSPQYDQFSHMQQQQQQQQQRGDPYGPHRNFAPAMQPGHFNGVLGLDMQPPGYPGQMQGLAGGEMGGKVPPGGFDLYSMGSNNGMFGPNSRAALAYNLANLQAQAHLNGIQSSAAASGKLNALGPAVNNLNLKALALAGGFGAFPNGLGPGGDSTGLQDVRDSSRSQQQQAGADYAVEAASNGAPLAVGGEFNYHEAAFATAQTPGWSS